MIRGAFINLIFKPKPAMKLNIDIFGEQNIFEVQPSDKILDLKDKIEKVKGIEKSCQRIFFKGKELEDNSTFDENKIKNKNILYLK